MNNLCANNNTGNNRNNINTNASSIRPSANDETGGAMGGGEADGSSRKQATRVFKKSSSNGKITVYLGKRDFVDYVTHVDPIDGVVFIGKFCCGRIVNLFNDSLAYADL